jgi:hypothetical protein
MPIVDDCFQRARAQVVEPELFPGLIEVRLRFFEGTKDIAGCRQTTKIWESLNRTDTASLYIAVRLRAVTATVLRAADKSRSAAHDADAEADRAVNWLKRAVAAGFKDTAQIKKDKDLDSLRDRNDFKKVVAELEGGKANAKP